MKKENPFKINFEFPLEHSDHTVTLNAEVVLHHSDPYYVVQSFYFENHKPDATISVLPPQEIKMITKGNQRLWVHKDSERESQLSIAIGRAIERMLD